MCRRQLRVALDRRPDAFLKVPLTQIPEVFVFHWPGVRGFGVLRS